MMRLLFLIIISLFFTIPESNTQIEKISKKMKKEKIGSRLIGVIGECSGEKIYKFFFFSLEFGKVIGCMKCGFLSFLIHQKGDKKNTSTTN